MKLVCCAHYRPSNKIRLVLENEHRKTVRKKSNAKYLGHDS